MSTDSTMVDDDLSQEIASHRPFLLRISRLQLGDAALAEDVVQEAILAALECRSAFNGRSTLRTWLVGILKYKVLDALRDKKKHLPCPSTSIHEEIATDDFDVLFDMQGTWREPMSVWIDPEAVAMQTDFARVLQVCLDNLPPNTARVFMLREFLEMETTEICSTTLLSSTNVRALLYRARMGLRACLYIKWIQSGDEIGGMQ